jgi:palmitoyltransferase
MNRPQEEPSLTDVLSLIFNFAACVPVWICVGCFSLYHLYLAAGNSTTIEGWEKDKVATLVRRGKIREIKYPYVRCARSTCALRASPTSR